jgi:hypothetical protein
MSYTLNAASFAEYDADDNPTTTADQNAAKAKEAADRLAAATDADSFRAAMRSILTDIGSAEEDIESAVNGASREHVLASTLAATDSAVSDWAFSAKAGETYTGGDGTTNFTVYLLTRAPYADESGTRNVRHILFSNEDYEDDTKANEVYAEWEAAGFTEAKLIELVPQYTHDTVSAENGGLYENVKNGDMTTEFNDWLFDESRKPGDHGLIEAASTGWHLMYYVGEGDKAAWQNAVESALKNADYDEMVKSYTDGITYNPAVYAQING